MRVALYIRVSTEEQAIHGLSIEAQTEALDAWSKSNRAIVADRYVDAGISARKKAIKRPALQRLLGDVQSGKVDLVVFTKLDRWFRNIAEYYKVQEILEKNHVNWKTIHEDYDTSTASGRLKINIMLSVAQDEADRTSERIRAVFDSKKERRETVTGGVPTGYRIVDKKIEKDPETEKMVAAYFEKYLKCGSVTQAVEYIHIRFGYLLKWQLASRMLSNPAYCGYFSGVDGMCPAYITKEQFDLIAAGRRNTSRKSKQNRIYLFSGLLFCGECGSRLGGRSHKIPRTGEASVEKAEYNCPGHYQHKGCGNRVNIREDDIESFLLQNAESIFRQMAVDYFSASQQFKPRNYSAEVKRIEHKLKKLKDLYVNDLIDMASYRTDYDLFQSQLQEIYSAKTMECPAPDYEYLESFFFDGWKDTYSAMSREEQRAFWRIVAPRIDIYPDRRIVPFIFGFSTTLFM